MKNNNTNNDKSVQSKKGAGSAYNESHAGEIPDYGMNDIDPNAKESTNMSNSKTLAEEE